ncbi:MAG TPA: transglycosylase SLT domain-containing protein [Anaerolineales bacterium]|nr:transglycosylase SLT domain-containing protein [Anaerolineales bacterium]
MPRARSTKTYWQTAATPQEQGSGCLSGFVLPPLAVVLFSAVFAFFVLKQPLTIPLELPPVRSKNISTIFRIEIHYWADSISKWATASQLDPNLVATVMQIESCGDPRAKSSAGAMGLFQVMPFHFYATDDPYNPNINALRGLAYLARSLETSAGNPGLALAGYNGGIGLIARTEWTWPAQTKRYVQYGLPIYEDARNGLESSNALNEWYQKYGVSLCQQAHRRLGLP